jgi:hypothetical protein
MDIPTDGPTGDQNTPVSPGAYSDLVAGIKTRVCPDAGEWDHVAFLRYRKRMGQWANAGLCKALGIPTARPPKPTRPAFLSAPGGSEDHRAELQRRLERLRSQSEPNDPMS